jgi:hypothetical protein
MHNFKKIHFKVCKKGDLIIYSKIKIFAKKTFVKSIFETSLFDFFKN